MSVAVQNQPTVPDITCQPVSPSQRPSPEIALELVLQMISILLNEMMKAAQGQGNMRQNPAAAQSPEEDVFSRNKSVRPDAGTPQAAPDTPQTPPVQPGGGAPQTTTGDTQATATGNVSADVGKPPAGMPAGLWQHCVEAGQKRGEDPFVLAAQMERESKFGKDLRGDSGGDGLMQVEPGTRDTYAAKFQEKMGHAYDHADEKDQVALAAVILADKGGDLTSRLMKYNGGDNWAPGATDSYGRVIEADKYAAAVIARADEMRKSAG
ncbi:transglycosylase SLT domain-containing protein [Ramlibacter tataouinensis]|uniref:Peptidoglycan lytic transglycosylase, Glycoside Hydrolase Family 23-like protein n=1 Tax=Ramlibacter tataouinensis (strain ATCC BAA-407 / DSM 14655 / LMG 21543 / TTB310) TaxID=365046 RepID=F5XVX4_RAMTT|nr:transglycosylase SLT domain-containing protein [Ramlibacter tataouinensis]AEG94077.1 peptidoglycan lytic transglycosylase, Glycoside Hydrolase Family 23-like protein [Ramlibacter tataouinensis TTB310]